MKLPYKHHCASWLSELRSFVRDRAAKSILAFLCQQPCPYMMMSLFPVSCCEGEMHYHSLDKHCRSLCMKVWNGLLSSDDDDKCINGLKCLMIFSSDRPVTFGVSVFFPCAPVKKVMFKSTCGSRGPHRMNVIRPKPLSIQIICKWNLLTWSTVCTRVSACFAPKQSMTSLLFPALDWNFYDATWPVLLGAPFKCCGGGIWRGAQQTSSCLPAREE